MLRVFAFLPGKGDRSGYFASGCLASVATNGSGVLRCKGGAPRAANAGRP